MNAFVEILCEHCGIVRVGPLARAFGDPYEYSATYVIRGEYAEIVGFHRPEIAGSEFRLIISRINEATGRLVAYDRVGNLTVRVAQRSLADTEGKIVMRSIETTQIDNEGIPRVRKNKHGSLPNLSEARHKDGTPNHKALLAGSELWNQAIANGEFHFTDITERPVDRDNDILILIRKKGPAPDLFPKGE